jgi:hypothetical protein
MKNIARGLVLLLTTWSLPAVAQTPVAITDEWPLEAPPAAPPGYKLGDGFERLDVVAALRSIYDRFTDLSRRSGQQIRFVLSDSKTYRPQEFGQVPLVDVMCPPRGNVLRTTQLLAGR